MAKFIVRYTPPGGGNDHLRESTVSASTKERAEYIVKNSVPTAQIVSSTEVKQK